MAPPRRGESQQSSGSPQPNGSPQAAGSTMGMPALMGSRKPAGSPKLVVSPQSVSLPHPMRPNAVAAPHLFAAPRWLALTRMWDRWGSVWANPGSNLDRSEGRSRVEMGSIWGLGQSVVARGIKYAQQWTISMAWLNTIQVPTLRKHNESGPCPSTARATTADARNARF